MRTAQVVNSEIGDDASWAGVLAGDADGFASIFDEHRDRVYRHALQMTANVHDAQDVTAGAFLELWRKRKSVRVVEGSVLPWLLVTTTNLARNQARGLRRYRSLIEGLPRSEEPTGPEDVAVEAITTRRTSDQLRRALETLSPSDAALIALTAFEHLGPAQAAAALGISEGAARVRLHRARARMASALENGSAGHHDDMTKGLLR